MSHGEGSVTEKLNRNGKSFKPKHWRICISYSVEETDAEGNAGKRRFKVQEIFIGTKAEALVRRDEMINERDDDGNIITQAQRVIDGTTNESLQATCLTTMIDLWNEARKTSGKASERTIREDRKRLGYIEKYLGDKPLEEINAPMIEKTYAAIREERNLSGTSMNHIHVLLKSVFEKAIDYDLVRRNPCRAVTAPKRNDPHRRSLSETEAGKLLERINEAETGEYAKLDEKETRREYREEHGYARDRSALRGIHHISNIIAVRLGFATGMRRGEVIGLVWKNVNLERRTIRVCQSATIKGTIKQPKTAAGCRSLAIDEETAAHLAYWLKRQTEELAKIDIEVTEDTPVCCTDVGTMMRVDNFESWWNAWRKKNGFPTLKFHELRHTQATVLLANGVDVKTVQTRLGHANPTITLGWYAHAIPENDHDAADMFGNLFNKKSMSPRDDSMSPRTVATRVAVANQSPMSPPCPPEGDFRVIKKQAS